MGVLKLFEGTGDMFCVVATIKTSEGSTQKVVDGAAFSVGRAPDCVLSIPEVGISRLHLLVTVKRGEVYITDQGSSNGTFVNNEKIESKRLIHVKPTDDVKLGKSDVVIQFGCIEKHFKTDYIAESLLPPQEKDNLLSIIKASHHKAQEIVGMAQSQADQLVALANEKARNVENQTILRQEEILSKAQVESQQIVSDTKRKAAQMIFEAEESARAATASIRLDADQKKHEAESYYQQKIKESQQHGDEIIAKHTKMGQEMIEGLRKSTIEKVEKEAKEQLSNLFNLIDEKSEELDKLQKSCEHYKVEKKNEINSELEKLKAEFLKTFEYEKQTTLDEHQSRLAVLEADFLHKKQEQEEKETNRIKEIESRIRNLNDKLDQEYADKRVRLERDYADKSTTVEREYSAKKSTLEEEYQKRQKELNDEFIKNQTETHNTLEKQRTMLEKEVESQRQNLLQIRNEIDENSEKHLDLKSKVENLTQTFKGLQKSENEVMLALQEKRAQLTSVVEEQKRIAAEIAEADAQLATIQKNHANLKAQFEADHAKFKKEFDQELQKSRAEIIKRSSEYEDLEKIKLEEYRSQVLSEKKQLDINLERTRKEFELKTKEVMEFEKKKLEDAKQQFLALMNNQRNVVTNELAKAVIKIERRGDPAVAPELISHAVAQVFDAHVAEFSVSAHTSNTPEAARRVRTQWFSYGVMASAMIVAAFIFIVRPQINRHIVGTVEHAEAVQSNIRPKFQPEQTLEYKDTYVEAALYTSKFTDIYLNEQIHDRWLKFITDYMFQTWRVPEEKTIEANSLAKSLVENTRARASDLEAAVAHLGVENMKEKEAETVKRMSDILGTQVKYEAFKRKEREFFEPYIQNQ